MCEMQGYHGDGNLYMKCFLSYHIDSWSIILQYVHCCPFCNCEFSVTKHKAKTWYSVCEPQVLLHTVYSGCLPYIKAWNILLMFHMWLFVWDVLRCATCIHVIAAVYSLSYYKKWICCSFLSIWLVKIQLRSHYSWSNSSFTLTHAMKYIYAHHTIFDKCCRFQNVCVHVCMLNTCLSVYDSVLA